MYQQQQQQRPMAYHQHYPSSSYQQMPPQPAHPNNASYRAPTARITAQPMLARPHSNPGYQCHPPPNMMTQPPYNRSVSQPSLPHLPCAQSQSGIVLQTLPQQQQQQTAKYLNDASMQMNLAQFSKYSQYQLQAALAAYPTWLQKEYVRRLQRQYEELYVVENPKILHSSSICPRKVPPPPPPQPQPHHHAHVHAHHHHHIESDILSDSEHSEYLSESADATLSPSPYAYSARDAGGEESTTTTTKFTFDETAIRQSNKMSTTTAIKSLAVKPMVTCFQILGDIKDEIVQIIAADNEVEEEDNVQLQSPMTPSPISPIVQKEGTLNAELEKAKMDAYRHQIAMQQYYAQQQQILLQQQQAMHRQQCQMMQQQHVQQQYAPYYYAQ